MSALAIIEEAPEGEMERPRTRGDCKDGPRPCPWISCRHHLLREIRGALPANLAQRSLPPQTLERIGSAVIEALSEMPETCALDVADRGGTTLEAVAQTLYLTRERVRQLEVRALLKLKGHPGKRRCLGDEE